MMNPAYFNGLGIMLESRNRNGHSYIHAEITTGRKLYYKSISIDKNDQSIEEYKWCIVQPAAVITTTAIIPLSS
jgi:hypothetical protein